MSRVPILSVCIPTFNRLHYLREMLATLLPQAEENGVEVCVSDNHSTDGTAQFLNEFSKNHLSLQYVTNSENVGIDRNMLAAIAMGTGRYIYPLGDDDMLPDGSLKEIIREVEKGGDLLILNGWHTTAFLIPTLMHLPKSIAGQSFSQLDKAFSALWDKMPFSSFLASRDCFSATHSEKFIGTSHAYASVWHALADMEKDGRGCQIRCSEKPTVLLRGGEKTWRKDEAIIKLCEIPHWLSLISKKEAYAGIIPQIKSDYLKSQTRILLLLKYRAIGQLEKSDLLKLERECTPEQVRKLSWVAKLPRVIARMAIKTKDLIKPFVKIVRRIAPSFM